VLLCPFVSSRGGAMYTSIRQYVFKPGVDKKTLDDYRGRIESTFVPRIQDIHGFTPTTW
jgi:hypothetical protein